MIKTETIRDKPWFAQDDELHESDNSDPKLKTVVWTSESYIAFGDT